jgi:peroxiredoxin
VASRGAALAIAAAVAAVVLAALLWSEPTPDPIRPGQAAPGFALPRLDDGRVVSLEELRGRVVLVNFWATWCRPCLDEMPAMERLYRSLRGSGFELLAISVDESRSEVEAFRERLGLTFPILLDPDRRVAHAYQSYRYPESYLIGADGRILSRYIGPRDWDARAYEERIRQVLAGGAASR